ncbi:hypothetical protein BJ944DRAFT_184015 [Cunninghamella echinulata]|nr:hypothetical protein BJ944DRAFT_184015 [Cunninghamella echinulata]
MTHTAFSFCYAPFKSSQYDTFNDTNNNNTDSTISIIQKTCNDIMTNHGSCHISISSITLPESTTTSTFHNAISVPLVDTPTDYNLTITGTHDTVMSARKDLLRSCPLKIKLELKMPASDVPKIFMTSSCYTSLFEKIKKETQAYMYMLLPSTQQDISYFDSENVITLRIIGLPYQVEMARTRFLVALDELMELHCDILKIPRKLHYLICGRKRATLQPIVDETMVNIYFPSPFSPLDNNTTDDKDDQLDEPSIYITGDAANVSRVKEMLTKLANQKAKSMYHKDTTLNSRKLDWMQLHRRDELCQIMHDNGSFIHLPPIGAQQSTVTVYAESRVNAERTLRSINFLACQIYEACFYFHNQDGVYSDPNIFNSISHLASLTASLSQVSGAEVAYRMDHGCVQVFGTERAVRNVYQRLHEIAYLKTFHHDTVFNVELSNEQREFISGKKNGKINKIMKTSGAKIKFLPFGEYNFILEVESTNFIKALDGLTLLQEELPAEISFYVPETYHKRIIGVGGKNIQRIMKKYGVYVKFSNAEEFASLGGYYGNEDNVVARTPMKNQINLDNLRHAVMDLITPKDKDFVIQTLSIPFRRHRILLCEYKSYLQEVTTKTSVKIIWPNHESASDMITLVGPQSNLDSAAQMVRRIVLDTYCFKVPASNQLFTILSSSEFEEKVTKKLQHEMDITLDIDESFNLPSSYIIPLKMSKANLDCLPVALDILVCHLRKYHVPLYKDISKDVSDSNNTRPNSNSSSNSIGNHFDSNILSTVVPSELPSPPGILPTHTSIVDKNNFGAYSLFDYPSGSNNINNNNSNNSNGLNAPWKNFRDNNNLRAIFDSPYNVNEQDPRMTGSNSIGPTSPTHVGYMNGYTNSTHHGGLVSHANVNSGLDIWSNPYGFQNNFSAVTSPPLTAVGSNGLTDQGHNLLYGNNDPSFYFHGYTPMMNGNGHNSQRPTSANTPLVDYHGMYVQPTSSTSSGSNNSLNSSKSMPESSMDLRQRSFQNSKQADTPVPISAVSPPLSTTAKVYRPEGSTMLINSAPPPPSQQQHRTNQPPSHIRSSRSSSFVTHHHHNTHDHHHTHPHHAHHHHAHHHHQTSPPPLAYPSSTTTFSMSPSSSSATNHSPLPRPLPSSASTPMIPAASGPTGNSSIIIGSNSIPMTFVDPSEKRGANMEFSSFYSPIEESNIDRLLSKISLRSSDQDNTTNSGFDQYQHHRRK